jgi:ATP phosphoribosyltransferase
MTGIPGKLNMAVPDGHLMNHVLPFIEDAGLFFQGYEKDRIERRPRLQPLSDESLKMIPEPDKVAIKVIRPQDMPTHVANANFDLAISGTDWLAEHKQRFPESPVMEKLRMGFGKVRIVAAAHEEKGNNLEEFINTFRAQNGKIHLRIASEYVYLADAFAQENRLHPYRVIMTYGATESLIPEDCDMIIENTETGNTLKKNHLKIISTLKILGVPWSEGCLIVSAKSMEIGWKRELIDAFTALFKKHLQSQKKT